MPFISNLKQSPRLFDPFIQLVQKKSHYEIILQYNILLLYLKRKIAAFKQKT